MFYSNTNNLISRRKHLCPW